MHTKKAGIRGPARDNDDLPRKNGSPTWNVIVARLKRSDKIKTYLCLTVRRVSQVFTRSRGGENRNSTGLLSSTAFGVNSQLYLVVIDSSHCHALSLSLFLNAER